MSAPPSTSTATRAKLPGLRERKAAETRLAIVASLERRLVDTELRDITADDLAADANVSRMTFFNYFPHKRDAVDMVTTVLLYRITIAVAERDLRGVAAIEHVFSAFGDEIATAPNRMRRMFGHFASRAPDRPLAPLTLAERMLLTPGVDVDAIARKPSDSLGGLLMDLIEEAQADGATIPGSSYEVGHYLGALLVGSALIGQSSPDTDWRRLLRRHARRALGRLGAEGVADPPPPHIPSQYRTRSRAR